MTIDFSGNRPVVQSDDFFKFTTGRVLSIEEGPDGALYYLTGFQTGAVFSFEGVVNRLFYNTGNNPPQGAGIVIGDGQESAISVPHSVAFLAEVTDPNGDDLSYMWSFGDGSSSTEASPTHTYTSPGTYTVELTVTDSNGASTNFPARTIVIGSAPVVTITGITDGGTYRAGQSFTIDGFADDAEDGRLGSTSLAWNSASFLDSVGRPGPFEEQPYKPGGLTFTTPSFGNVESLLNGLAVFLTAVDSDGVSTTAEVNLKAEQSTLTFNGPFDTDEFFLFDGQTVASDFSFKSTIGFSHEAETPLTYTAPNGSTFVFSQWSDGVTTAVRSFTTPAVDTMFTPVYVPQ